MTVAQNARSRLAVVVIAAAVAVTAGSGVRPGLDSALRPRRNLGVPGVARCERIATPSGPGPLCRQRNPQRGVDSDLLSRAPAAAGGSRDPGAPNHDRRADRARASLLALGRCRAGALRAMGRLRGHLDLG